MLKRSLPVTATAACVLTVLVGIGDARAQMALPGAFELSDTGAASYTIPIAVPPGTSGMQPSLSLVYNNQSGNGLLGLGWTLSGVPAITRCTRTIVQDGVSGSVKYDANDRFCMEGQRLVAISGTYGADQTEYRTEHEGFSKVVSYGSAGGGPASFKVWTKSGQVIEFGNTADSRIEAQGKSAVRVWSANKISDTKGNAIEIVYAEDNVNAQYYPSRINYTSNATAGIAAFASVRFHYISRPDNYPSYEAGSQFRLPDLVDRIYTYVGETLVRDYRLVYTGSPSTGRMRLDSVQLCDGATPANCLPATQFTWQNPPAGTGFQWTGTLTTPFGDVNEAVVGRRWFEMDVNADGRMDMVIRDASGVLNVYLADGTNFVGSDFTVTPFGDASESSLGARWFPMDVNGDGQMDMVIRGAGALNTYLSNGTKFVGAGVFLIPTFGDYDEAVAGRRFFPMDVNGDGKTDMVIRDASGVLNVYLSNGTNFVGSGFTVTPFGDASEGTTGPHWFPMDVNGDGKMDMVVRGAGALNVYLSDGTKFVGAGVFLTPTFGDYNESLVGRRFFPMDVNGDGLLDMVIRDASGVLNVYVSDGFTFVPSGFTITPFGDTNEGISGTRFFPMDVNGDGKMDMMIRGGGGALNVYVSDGIKFVPSWFTVTPFGDANEGTAGRRFFVMDVNGDGKSDFVGRSQDGQLLVYRSTGVSFVLDSTTATGLPDQSASAGPRWFETDATGDGRTDMVIRAANAIGTFKANGPFPDLLTGITNNVGVSTTITYKALSEGYTLYARGTGAVFPVVDYRGPLYVVSNVDTNDGIGGVYHSTYAYNYARFHVHGRGFLGFERVIARDDQTEIEQVTTYRQDYPFIGLVASREKRLRHLLTPTVWQTLNETVNTYSSTSLGSGRSFVFLQQSVERSWELSGALVSQVTTQHAYDTFGNATAVTVSTPDGYSKTTTNTYANDTLNWLLGRLTRASVTSVTP